MFVFLSRILLLSLLTAHLRASPHPVQPASALQPKTKSIPFSEIGARLTANYHGPELGVSQLPGGARLQTDFQKLSATVDGRGLWLASTAQNGGNLQLRADVIDRGTGIPLLLPVDGTVVVKEGAEDSARVVAFTRREVTEEYSVSVDGLRQDFVIENQPPGSGSLSLELSLTGAHAQKVEAGVHLILAGSGRTLAYGRLKVTDACGHIMDATLDVLSPDRLIVRIADDTWAAYPLRIDPTFSDADWVSLNPEGMPGADEHVIASTVDASGNLYIGGTFAFVGKAAANRVAKWDGSAWSALGSGMPGGFDSVSALAVIGTNVYAAGQFATAGGIAANNIAKWNGSAWSALGAGLGAEYEGVTTLAVMGSDLYAGGIFTVAGGLGVQNVAKWNGSQWSALGTGINGYVAALAVQGSKLYVGGSFATAGGIPANNIAKWEGGSWSALGQGMIGEGVNALAASSSTLYAGGHFNMAGGVEVQNIAKWNGSFWSALRSGVGGDVRCLALAGTDLYVGGDFSYADGTFAPYAAKWNGSSWSALGRGTNYRLYTISVIGNAVYAGGEFFEAGGLPIRNIAKWNGVAWSALGLGMDSPVHTVVVMGGNIYAGGQFVTAGGVTVNKIAKWNGISWSALGSGIAGAVVVALAVKGSDLYAGGTFFKAGGVPVSNIAKWNGNTWSSPAAGLGTAGAAMVRSIAAMGEDIYAGGTFSHAGNISVNNIAKWNGTTWSALSAGLGGQYSEVRSLAAIGSDLYAGGVFSIPGVTGANSIAQWNGTAWSALGTGTNGIVSALAVNGSTLYAGGSFSTAGSTAANNVASWNGTAWSALGQGLSGTDGVTYDPASVLALTVNDTDLFAAGHFTLAEGKAVKHIARWDGRSWSALASGIDGNPYRQDYNGLRLKVSSLAMNGTDLYVGGSYFTAGNKISPFLSKANIPVTAVDAYSAAATAAGLTGTWAEAGSVPFSDGVKNLLKFAFHMNLAGPDVRVLQPGEGTAGLPDVYVLPAAGGQMTLGVRYIRLKGSYLTYTPKVSTELGTFTKMTGTESVTSLDDTWERVTLEQIYDPAVAPKCFVVVEVKGPT